MKTSAIISEYNPLHLGHLHHIEYTKKETGCDALICIMSGSFTQRGVPAIIDKWTRAEMAIKSGIDLVIELPVIYSVASAEFFSRGAVEILDKLNIINFLSFGSESGDIELIRTIGQILAEEPEAYTINLKNNLKSGLPFTQARTNALKAYMKDKSIYKGSIETFLNSSNNILAIEYCKALIKLNSNIKPITLKRLGDSYNATVPKSAFTSATALRNIISAGAFGEIKKYVSEEVNKTIISLLENEYTFAFSEAMFPYLKYKLFTDLHLKGIPDAGEGLDNKLYKGALKSNCLEELIMQGKSKRYTYTRISRILCQYFLGFEEYPIELMRKESPEYCRVLAFNDIGRELLKEIKKKTELNIITKLPKTPSPMLELDIKSTKAYSILNPRIKPNEDYFRSPSYLKAF